ncbi:hypothetical protein MSG28_005165 [Choristoneura fumiferana]|uniref:Uncharacterized protein n=1 Tax=Choristoneura fumiferana TaxID=7141 RepID=A0ACC0JQV3_CHOFU|nr:hypothetical protein MSG28_005165 [Choristoneura fumiferana]
MRKRKSLKKGDEDSEGSEPAAEPEEFQDSGEDWTPDADSNEQPGARVGRKRSQQRGPALNNSKKKRKDESSEESEGEGEEDEEGEGEEDEGELDEEEGSDDEKNGSDGNKSDSSQSKDIPKHFHSGNFVLLKSDVKWDGDTVTSKLDELNLWKIDGKALLQKFIPMESSGKILHKCTCVYSGWNVDNRENYYPITEILDRNPRTDSKEICVALDLNDLIKCRPAKATRLRVPALAEAIIVLTRSLCWWKYDERSNVELETAFNAGEPECTLLLAGALYRINFQSMVQMRQSDRTRRRRVQRDTPTLPAKGC